MHSYSVFSCCLDYSVDVPQFDERNPDGSFDYDYWDDEDNLNNQLEDFGGEIPNVRLDPAQILGKNTSE